MAERGLGTLVRAQLSGDQVPQWRQVGEGGSLHRPGSGGRNPTDIPSPSPTAAAWPGPTQDAHLTSWEGEIPPRRAGFRRSLRGSEPRPPIQTARGRHPFTTRPLPASTHLASKPIGRCKRRWTNPLPRCRNAASDWSFRMDLKIKSSPFPHVRRRRRSSRAFLLLEKGAGAGGGAHVLLRGEVLNRFFRQSRARPLIRQTGVVYHLLPAGECSRVKTFKTARTFLLAY